ncbi:MAG: hypothetical protein RDA78_01620 [Roseibium sp.]|uniref:hypothetical protein n=1 Tax=Roseibium sp. TaxID=1936156 RepID=UPI003D9C61DF
MNLRIFLACIICFPSIAPFQSPAWGWQTKLANANCEGRWVSAQGSGYVCICPDGSQAQTSDLVVFRCPATSLPKTRAEPSSEPTPSRDQSALTIQQAVQNEAKAREALASAEKEESKAREILEEARSAQKLASKTLADAKESMDSLQRQADATSDPEKKLELLKRKLKLAESARDVAREREQLTEGIPKLEERVNRANQATIDAKSNLDRATQLRVAAAKQKPVSSSRSTKPPVNPKAPSITTSNGKSQRTTVMDLTYESEYQKIDGDKKSAKLVEYANSGILGAPMRGHMEVFYTKTLSDKYDEDFVTTILVRLAERNNISLNDLKVLNDTRNRNQIPRLTYDQISSGSNGWTKSEEAQSAFHTIGIDDPSKIEKWTHEHGSEVVFDVSDPDNKKIVTDATNKGTYNYDSGNGEKHLLLDIIPWIKWGTGPDDTQSAARRWELWSKAAKSGVVRLPAEALK